MVMTLTSPAGKMRIDAHLSDTLAQSGNHEIKYRIRMRRLRKRAWTCRHLPKASMLNADPISWWVNEGRAHASIRRTAAPTVICHHAQARVRQLRRQVFAADWARKVALPKTNGVVSQT